MKPQITLSAAFIRVPDFARAMLRLSVSSLLLSATLAAAGHAQLPGVRALEVPSKYPTIQLAIDSARNGDSVIVSPGIYRENIRFNGRNIVLASRFIRSHNTQDILNTVIAGTPHAHPDSGTTVLIVDREDVSAVLEGFTIIGGPGTVWYDAAAHNRFREGGAILCDFSAPTIRYNRILGGRVVAPRNAVFRSSGGGGIRCGYGEPTIEGNLIAGNRARYGAGLVLFQSAATTRNNIFADNAGGEDLGGGGAWIIGNLSRRLTSELNNNTFLSNAVVGVDSGVDRNMIGKGGGAIFARVNMNVTGNVFAGNAQAATNQMAVGPGVVGKMQEGARGQSAQAGAPVGAFGIPQTLLLPSAGGATGPSADVKTRAVLTAMAESRDSIAMAFAAVSLKQRRSELLAADSAFGRMRTIGISNRLTEPLARNALVIGPGTTLWRTAEATRVALLEDTSKANAQLFWAPVKGDVSADGTEGYTFGFLDVVGGSSPRRQWKYLAYWRREPGGAWRMIAHKRLPRAAGEHVAAAPAEFGAPTNGIGTWFPSGPRALGELFAVDSAFARAAQQNAEKAFLAYTARDGAILSSDANFAWGKVNVAKEFAAFGPGTIDWAPDAGVLAPGGDLGFATGEVIIRERRPDGSLVETTRGRYLTIWKRESDGSWKLIIDG